MQITILQNILAANDAKAEELRNLLAAKKILMLNLISSPGAGKTTILEKTLAALSHYRIAIIEGDIATDRDAVRLGKYGVPIALVTTSGACHLESVSIEQALQAFDLDNLDVIFVENVGNLVCPAEFDIGEDHKIAILSIPEGDDKPSKYPLLFHEASLAILNKIDLLEHVSFNKKNFYRDLTTSYPQLTVFETSCTTGSGLQAWFTWVTEQILAKRLV